MSVINKEAITKYCDGEVVERLVEEFHEHAMRSGASALETLVAATTFATIVGEAIEDPKLRTAMMDALVEMSLQ